VIAVDLAGARVDAVGGDDEVAVAEVRDGHLGLEAHRDAQLAAALL